MIAKTSKGRGFRGILNYAMEKDCEILDSNMAGQTPRALAAEFGEVRKLRPTLGKAVVHTALSAPVGEHISDDLWREIGQNFREKMGYTDNQFIMVKHKDTDHQHVHIIANRITHTGEVVSDANDYKRLNKTMREIELEYGLTQVASISERKAPTKGEIERSVRTGEPSTRQQLQQLASAAALDCRSYTDYAQRLETVGVELIPYTQMDDTKLNGLMYRLDGVSMKGSDLGKAYAPSGLAKQGVTYVKDRDVAEIKRASEREAHRAAQEQNLGLEKPATAVSGRTGGLDQPFGVSNGATDGGELRINPADRDERQTDRPAHERDPRPSPASGRRDAESRNTHHAENNSNRSGDRTDRSDGYGWIIRLGRQQAPTRTSQPRRASGSGNTRTSDTERDNRAAAQQQIAAFHKAAIIAIPQKRRGKGFSANVQDIKAHWVELQRQQALGAAIQMQIRQSNLITMKDLNSKAIERMTQDGFPSLLVTEKDGRHTAVIRIDKLDGVPREWQETIGRHLEKTYGGRSFTEVNIPLAGFDGVKLVSTDDRTAPRGLVILKDFARQQIENERAQAFEQEKTHRWGVVEKTIHAGVVYGAEREYIKLAGKLHDKRHDSEQTEQIDTRIAKDLLIAGFDGKDIASAIEKRSPSAAAVENSPKYAQNRVEQALEDAEVQQVLQERQRQQNNTKPHDRESGFGPSMGR